MSDTQAAMREFRFLDEKRKTGGLSQVEEQRWMELAGQLGVDISQQLGGYWGQDGQWYAYPQQGYDPNAYYPPQDPYAQQQQQGYYDANGQYYPPQQPAYDPNAGYYPPQDPYAQQPQQQDPYAQPPQDPYAQPPQDPYAQPPQQDPYAQQPLQDPYTQPQQGYYDPNANAQYGYPQQQQQYPQAYAQPQPQQQWAPPAAAWQPPAPLPVPAPAPIPAPVAPAAGDGPLEVTDDEVMEVSDEDVTLLDPTPAAPAPAPSVPKYNKPIFSAERPLASAKAAHPVKPEAPLAKPDPVADLRSALSLDDELAVAPTAPSPKPADAVKPFESAASSQWTNRIAVPVDLPKAPEPMPVVPSPPLPAAPAPSPMAELSIEVDEEEPPAAAPVLDDIPAPRPSIPISITVEEPAYETPLRAAPAPVFEPSVVEARPPPPASTPAPFDDDLPMVVSEPTPVVPRPVAVEPEPVQVAVIAERVVAEPFSSPPSREPEPAPVSPEAVFVPPATPEPVTIEQPIPTPVIAAPLLPITAEQPGPEPVFVAPALPEPITVEQPVAEPVLAMPASPEPMMDEQPAHPPVFASPAPLEPITVEHAMPEPALVIAEVETEPAVAVAEAPPSPEPSIIVSDLPTVIVSEPEPLAPPPSPPAPAPAPPPMPQEPEPSIVVAPELGAHTIEAPVVDAIIEASADEWSSEPPPPPPPPPNEWSEPPPPPPPAEWSQSESPQLLDVRAKPVDFDVEVDEAPLPVETPVDLSGSSDDPIELARTSEFLPFQPSEPAPVEIEATVLPPEEPSPIESQSLAMLANPNAVELPFEDEHTSPGDDPVPLATNADFLGRPELNNTGESWQRSGPIALDIDDTSQTDAQIVLPPVARVALGAEEDDDTDIVQGIVIDDVEEEVTAQTDAAVPSREMFAQAATIPVMPAPAPAPYIAPPPPPPPVQTWQPPAPPPVAPPPVAARPAPSFAAPPPPPVRSPEPQLPPQPKKPITLVPGPPVGAQKPGDAFDRTGPALQPEETHIVVKGEHRVILHTLEGQVKRGAIRDADLSADHVALEGGTGVAAERIPRARVKAIFFMLPAGTKAPAADGQKVRVTFKDGRQVAGYSKDHKSPGPGFFVVPADNRTNTSRIFIFRHSVQAIAVD